MNPPYEFSTRRSVSNKIVWRLLTLTIAAATVLGISASSHIVYGQSTEQADSTDTSPIDPAVIEALNKMGTYLRALPAYQVTANITKDDVTEDGQTIQSGTKVDLMAVRPNRLRAEITADDRHQFLYFDGKNFTMYGTHLNYYATVPAPPTLADLAKAVYDKYGIELPLVDLFLWGTNDANVKRIKSAIDIGPTSIDNITCEHYAFHQQDIDWQLWIQLGDFPLPRKLVIRTLTDDARPQFSETLSWNLAPSYSDDAFTFTPPPGAERISIAVVQNSSTDTSSGTAK